jgi:two-component system phosphate regulon response regulator PhoB
MKILIVDDNIQMRTLLGITFSTKPEYEIIQAENGADALDIIRTQHIDIMFLDIMMPGEIAGLDVCKSVKASEEYKSCFVVLLSAKGQKSDIELGLSMGADMYLTKPFSPISLLELVDGLTS